MRVQPDPEIRSFLQRATGYSLTGETTEEKLFFLHGPTATGKSTILEALRGKSFFLRKVRSAISLLSSFLYKSPACSPIFSSAIRVFSPRRTASWSMYDCVRALA